MILYTNQLQIIDELNLDGFFVGWPNPPSYESFKKILKQSYMVILAHENDKLVGFINCISDGVLSAYIPLLEVLPEYQGRGIGKELFYKMKGALSEFYMVDVLCDQNIVPFYTNLGMKEASGVCIRNYKKQSGI